MFRPLLTCMFFLVCRPRSISCAVNSCLCLLRHLFQSRCQCLLGPEHHPWRPSSDYFCFCFCMSMFYYSLIRNLNLDLFLFIHVAKFAEGRGRVHFFIGHATAIASRQRTLYVRGVDRGGVGSPGIHATSLTDDWFEEREGHFYP